MIKGSCACGAVRFELMNTPEMMGTCHCSRCRKLGDSTAVFVKRANLHWLAGKEDVAHHLPEPPHIYGRSFCRHCGSSLGEILSEAESFPIAATAFDDPLGLKVSYHIFTADKPDWYEVCDSAPQFPGQFEG